MYKHTVVFERVVNGRVHRFSYSMNCRLHLEIVEAVFERALRRNVVVDLNMLIDSMILTKDDIKNESQ